MAKITDEELAKIDVNKLKMAYPGDCFHGEVWVKCPHCTCGNEIMGVRTHKDGYIIIRCSHCGQIFKDK